MADPVIVWSDDPEIPGNLMGMVSGVKYFRIYPTFSGFKLFSSLPFELDVITNDPEVQVLKDLATSELSKFLATTKDQMVVMGLLT